MPEFDHDLDLDLDCTRDWLLWGECFHDSDSGDRLNLSDTVRFRVTYSDADGTMFDTIQATAPGR